jgi:branched-chain amino acid transport system substrate-binding protein
MESETFLVGSNSGPAAIAGNLCNPHFFAAGFQMDTVDESMGRYLSEKGVNKVITLAPNYIAGRDAIASFKRTFKGEVAAELYTGLEQVDYSAELAQLKASGVHDVYVFYPGGFGITFLRQFYQAGLRNSIHVYSKGTSDWTSIAAQGPAAVGSFEFVHWNADIDNPANKRFVADYTKTYGYPPSAYSDQGYDSAQVIDAAVKAVNGNLNDKKGLLNALRTVKIESPRGPFKFNRNQFPIHNQYLVETVMGKDGKPTIITTDFAYRDVQDSHVGKCPMP